MTNKPYVDNGLKEQITRTPAANSGLPQLPAV
jgi:hypothetical protein